MSGVSATGFVPKTVDELQTDISEAETSIIDPTLDTSPEEPIGQLNGIFASKLAELWELAGVAYNGYNRDSAEGPQLDNCNGLTGTKRLPATPSYTLQTCIFSQDGTYPAGSLTVSVNGQTSVQFTNGFDVVIVLSGLNHIATVAGKVLATSPTLPITVPKIKFLCTQNGPTIANAGTLATIATPVVGWTSTTNPTDATLGSLIEQDTPYRLRGDQEISAVGSGNPDALRADLLNVPGVIQAFVIENTGDSQDAYGNPAHSFRVVIWDGASPAASDDDIAQVIWDDKPTGIDPVGLVTDGQALDSNNQIHYMPFNRAAQDLLYLDITATPIPGVIIDSTLALAIKQAIVTSTLSKFVTAPNGTPALNPAYLALGNTVVAEAMKSAVLASGLGVLDVPSLKLGFSPAPVGTANLDVGNLAIALADTSRITINGL